MADFKFLQNPVSKRWVISAPRRARRPDAASGTMHICPFCPGRELENKEFYRIGGEVGDPHWEVIVIPNKFPFAPIHELILNSPDHNASFDSFPREHIQRILQVYRHRFNEHNYKGQVYIFHNHGEKAGESIPHSHTQLTVIPDKVHLEIPHLRSVVKDIPQGLVTDHFTIFCPKTSTWSDEVWIAPRKAGRQFGEVTDDELADFAGILSSLTKIYELRYNREFPYNFYIYPNEDWYFRLIPRKRMLGGFEIGTHVFVNTQSPEETMNFIREHFKEPNIGKILKEHQAEYHTTV